MYLASECGIDDKTVPEDVLQMMTYNKYFKNLFHTYIKCLLE